MVVATQQPSLKKNKGGSLIETTAEKNIFKGGSLIPTTSSNITFRGRYLNGTTTSNDFKGMVEFPTLQMLALSCKKNYLY